MAQHETATIPLENIREEYFGISTKAEADRRAKRHELPVPAFKLGKQRSTWLIHVEELASFIDKTALEQKETWKRMNTA